MTKHSLRKSIFLTLISSVLVLASCSSQPVNARASEPNDYGAETASKKRFYYSWRGTTDDDEIWYSDDFFASPSTEYNPHLATLSITTAKYSMNPGGPDNLEDTTYYQAQAHRVEHFWNDVCGFSDPRHNADYESRTAFDTIGVACASKVIGDYCVIACVVRSGGYYLEWENNVYLGDGSKSDMMHEGWYNAAIKVNNFINDYIDNVAYEKATNKKIKLWMSGFSRGAATMNIAAGLLDNKFDANGNQQLGKGDKLVTLNHDGLYAYTFETPQGANLNSTGVKHPKDPIYNNIFNVINPNDLVTKVAMAPKFGFTRFGIDKFSQTRFFDPDNYDDYLNSFKKLYGALIGSNVTDLSIDNLTIYNIPIGEILLDVTSFIGFAIDMVTQYAEKGTVKLPSFFEEDSTKVKYDANIVTTVIIEEATFYIGSRSNYVENFQPAARELLKALQTDSSGLEKAVEIEEIILKIGLASLVDYYFGSLGVDILSAIFGENFVALDAIGPIIQALAHVFLVYPNEVMGLIGSISDMFDNHSTNINVARLMVQDSLYVDDYNRNQADPGKIKLYNLRKNASMGRLTFKDFNDLGLYNVDKDNQREVSIDGHYFGASDITTCFDGCAAGYYSYSDYEALEVWMRPVYHYHVNFTDYSKKPYHLINGYYWYYPINNQLIENKDDYYRQFRRLYEDYEWWSSDTHRNELPAKDDPE